MILFYLGILAIVLMILGIILSQIAYRLERKDH